jgi:Holliday junction resolvase
MGVRAMEKPIIICFECRKRTNPEDIKLGYHSHADLLEFEDPFDAAAVNGADD